MNLSPFPEVSFLPSILIPGFFLNFSLSKSVGYPDVPFPSPNQQLLKGGQGGLKAAHKIDFLGNFLKLGVGWGWGVLKEWWDVSWSVYTLVTSLSTDLCCHTVLSWPCTGQVMRSLIAVLSLHNVLSAHSESTLSWPFGLATVLVRHRQPLT